MKHDRTLSPKTSSTDCAVIIVAAGSGSRAACPRLQNTLPKQFWQLGEKPVFRYALDYFTIHPRVGRTVLVVAPEFLDHARHLTADLASKIDIVAGGATRQDSVRAGLYALAKHSNAATLLYVAIHDAARPFVPATLLEEMLDELETAGPHVAGAVPVLPVSDSLKTCSPGKQTLDKGLDRSQIVAAQTPQLFYRSLITAIHTEFADTDDRAGFNNFTDDCELSEAHGHKVIAVTGAKSLMKLTDQADFAILSAILPTVMGTTETENRQMTEIRIGNGFDVHAFIDEAGPIWVSGIKFESNRKIAAHSDGDVAIHALCDAIFGAIADGDIGAHFPPSESKWKDADSSQFLRYAVDRVKARGGRIVNLDLTIICETPKIGPHRDLMRQHIADICEISIDRISVKATTSEQLGFTGRGEGIAAQASASIMILTSGS
jgi:2-C-methyl-D-erythritol 4-phosphate cytidylyltransferase/2-C-methyl-D-erythritol 2,4-cyclodiphosphate synthase